MRKLLIFLGVVIVLLFSTPFFIKDNLIQKELQKIQKEQGITITYATSEINPFTFPNITVQINDLNIKNEKIDTNQQISTINYLRLAISFGQLFNDNPTISSLEIDGGNTSLVIDKNGVRNFDFISEKKEPLKQQPTICSITLKGFILDFKDLQQNITLSSTINSFELNETKSIDCSLDGVLTNLSLKGENTYSNRNFKISAKGKRSKSKVEIHSSQLALGQLELNIEAIKKNEWRISSSSTNVEDFFELFPDLSRPTISDFSSNKPMLVDVTFRKDKIKKAKIIADHIILSNKNTKDQLSDINFSYNFKKRSSKLENLTITGAGMNIKGECISGKLKENQVEATITGAIDFTSFVDFFYSNRYTGQGNLSFTSAISKQKEKLAATLNAENISIKAGDDVICAFSGRTNLSNESLLVKEIKFQHKKNNFSIDGKINNPINYFLFNQQPIEGSFSINSDQVNLPKTQLNQFSFSFNFGLIPSTKYLYLIGMPFDPFAQPTYFKIESLKFGLPQLKNAPVQLSMDYELNDNIHLKDLSLQIDDASIKFELKSKKPTNLALFAFEKQHFWAKTTYSNLNPASFSKQLGLKNSLNKTINGSCEAEVKYDPSQIISGSKIDYLAFNKVEGDLTIDEEKLLVTGNALYDNDKLSTKGLIIKEGNKELIETFIMSLF